MRFRVRINGRIRVSTRYIYGMTSWYNGIIIALIWIGFHSWVGETIGNVSIRMELNSHRINLGNKYGSHFIALAYKYGHHDVRWN